MSEQLPAPLPAVQLEMAVVGTPKYPSGTSTADVQLLHVWVKEVGVPSTLVFVHAKSLVVLVSAGVLEIAADSVPEINPAQFSATCVNPSASTYGRLLCVKDCAGFSPGLLDDNQAL